MGTLSFGYNSVPEALGQLSSLQTLDLSDNQLASVPEALGQLSSLQSLELTNNQLASVPEALGQLSSLRTLLLDNNQLASVPEALGQLSSLRTLWLDNNQLASVPEALGQLSSLRTLWLHKNQLASVPDALGQLPILQKLSLSNNQFATVPEALRQLSGLQHLFLHNNQLASVPDALQSLTKLKILLLHNNPALNLPESVLGKLTEDPNAAAKPADILAYYFETRQAARPLLEAKLILVGRGGVGKSSLVDRLVTNTFDSKKTQTDGIAITEWQVKLKPKETARLNIWDFGGQEIMHSTHQFFLTERSLYLVVLNGREGFEDEDAEYWLKLVASFGKGSPAIVVLNKIKTTPFDLDETELKRRYPFIRAFIRSDCSGKRPPGIATLRKAIRIQTDALEGIRASFPASWFGIKDRLAEMTEKGENFLSPEQYRKICRDHKEPDPIKQKQLAGFLHDLGVALNYADDQRLRHTHVLNPHWVTNGIYKILTSKKLQEKHGELEFDDLAGILPAKDYPVEMRQYLCDLMRRFELGFNYPDHQDRYLVPQLLPKNTPEEAAKFDRSETLDFEYTYPTMMPEGLLPRFIVRTHSLSQNLARWRSGVIIEMGAARALVHGQTTEKRVRISVVGPEHDRQRFLATIRYDFDHIHKEIGLEVDERLVPQALDMPISLEELKAFEAAGKKHFDRYFKGKIQTFNVKELLDRFDPKGHRHEQSDIRKAKKLPEVFYSYAHKDERHLNLLQMHLKALEADRLISSWYDRNIPPGDEWDRAIHERIHSADIILLLVSPAFIASEYIREKEMTAAMKRHEAGDAVVIPVILEKCLWKNRAVFKKLQAVPRDAKPIRDWNPQRDGWFDVAEHIEKRAELIGKKRTKGQRESISVASIRPVTPKRNKF